MIEYENLNRTNAFFADDLKAAFARTLESGYFILGKNVETFEHEFAGYCGSKSCIGVASGLDALVIALKAFGFAPNAEIIVPANTYIASITSIILSGFKPVLVEPDIRTYNIDPSLLEQAITPRTAAIMVVHLYGKPCDMAPIREIAKRHELKIIEDDAQAHGAEYKGKKVGTLGDAGAFSYYPTKNLGALGDAGSITTDDDDFAAACRQMRNYGSSAKYKNETVGYNSRLDEVQAGFLSVKLKRLDEVNAHKRALARLYLDGLSDQFIKPVQIPGCEDVFHIFPIRHPRRDELKAYLLENGIKTDIHYPIPPHQQTALLPSFGSQRFPLTEEIHQTILSLPISFFHTPDDIAEVIRVMNAFAL